jgi:hypothetical protein
MFSFQGQLESFSALHCGDNKTESYLSRHHKTRQRLVYLLSEDKKFAVKRPYSANHPSMINRSRANIE